jgi:hypothetical protein
MAIVELNTRMRKGFIGYKCIRPTLLFRMCDVVRANGLNLNCQRPCSYAAGLHRTQEMLRFGVGNEELKEILNTGFLQEKAPTAAPPFLLSVYPLRP